MTAAIADVYTLAPGPITALLLIDALLLLVVVAQVVRQVRS